MNTRDKSLDEQLRNLPQAVEPPQDLWPAISAAIESSRKPRWPIALAASLLLVTVGSLFAWKVVPHTDAVTANNTPVPANARPVNSASSRQAAYLQAHAQLETLFHDRLGLLRPETREKIETNLKIIRDANDNIRRALEDDPASPLLLELLENNQQQEIKLYSSVVRNTEPALSRS